MDETQRLRDRVAALEDENADLHVTIEDLHDRISDLDSENVALDALIENLRAEAEDLDMQLAALDAEVDALRAEAFGERGSDEERVYLASKRRKHFHRPGCKWAGYIPADLLIEFDSHAEAVAAQYRPCKTCRA